MLPAASRLRLRTEFTAAVRQGQRAGRSHVVVHLDTSREASEPSDVAPRAGFVVGRTVGGAVVRNRVRRRLRHLMAPRLADLPAGARVVVRALPPAAGATTPELANDLDAALARCLSAPSSRTSSRTSL